MSFANASPTLQKIVEDKIARQIKYHTSSNGQTAPIVFRLAGTDTNLPNAKIHETNLPVKRRQSAVFPSEMNIFDPYKDDKGNILYERTIKNVISSKMVYDETGKGRLVEEGEEIVFERGQCQVYVTQKSKLMILMFAHYNISKPDKLKDPKIVEGFLSPCWEEVRETMYVGTTVNEKAEADMFMFVLKEAQKYPEEKKRLFLNKVAETQKRPELVADEKSSKAIDNDFWLVVRTNPRVFLDTNVDEIVKVRAMVYDALHRGYLTHNESTASYKMGEKNFWSYPKVTTKDPEQALVEYLLKEKPSQGYDKPRHLDWLDKTLNPQHPYLPKEEVEVEQEVEQEVEVS